MSPIKLISLGYKQPYLKTALWTAASLCLCQLTLIIFNINYTSQYKLDQYTHTCIHTL